MTKASAQSQSQSSEWVDYYYCGLMPHGSIILIPIALATLAWLTSIAHDGCDYARLYGPAVAILTGSTAIPFVDLGMAEYRIPEFYPASNTWHVAYSDECSRYNYTIQDKVWLAGEWLSFLAMVFGGSVMMFLWCGTCFVLRPFHWKAAGLVAALAFICQALSFIWFLTRLCHTSSESIQDFESDVEETDSQNDSSSCSLFFGSKCSITSTALYFLTSIVILFEEYPAPVPRLIVKEEKIAMIRVPRRISDGSWSQNSKSSSSTSKTKIISNLASTPRNSVLVSKNALSLEQQRASLRASMRSGQEGEANQSGLSLTWA